MSTLDHNLVVGNSLTGIGTVDEVLGVLEPGRTARQRSFFADEIESALASANDRLQRAARTAEATKAEVREAAKAHASAMNDAADAKALFDAAIGVRLKVIPLPVGPESAIVQGNGESVQAKVKALRAAHFPYFFPEVFLRHNPGFDVLIGNPPWEKIKVEEHIWWGAHFPGLRGLSQRDKNRAIVQYRTSRPDLEREFGYDYDVAKSMSAVIAAGPFPDIRKATDVDLFAAFCWRFWYLLREGGYSGIVLPRTALAGAAAVGWRKKVLSAGAIPDLTMLVNHREWVFADIHSQTTVGLITVTKSNLSPGVALRGPYADFSSYSKGMAAGTNEIAQLSPETVLAWSRTAAFPLLPASDLEVFAAMKAHPALGQTVGDWSFRPIRELHTTDNKEMFDFNLASPDPANTLPVWTGGSFNLWAPGSGEPYAYANLTEVVAFLNARRLRSARRAGTAFVGLAARDLANVDTLPMFAPRIAFRDVTNRENQRTLICALVPPGIALVEKAPYLLRQQGTERDEAYLLGILSSMPFDWYVRRYVERKMSYELLLTFPVPRVESQTGKCLAADGRLAGRDVDLRPARDRVTEIAALLGAVDGRYTAWAEAVGTGFNPVTAPDERFGLMCELDAVAALLFRLTRSQVEKLYETFSPSWDYRPRLAAVLAHYNRWAAALLGRENR